MALVVHCPSCKTWLTLGDDRAGTALDCPRCDAPIDVPPRIVPDSVPDLLFPAAPTVTATVPSKVRFKCPACAKVYKTNRGDVGKKMLCKGCGAVVIIPDAPNPKPKPLLGIPLPPTGDDEPEEALPEARSADEPAASPERPLPPFPTAPPVVYDWPASPGEDRPHEGAVPDSAVATLPAHARDESSSTGRTHGRVPVGPAPRAAPTPVGEPLDDEAVPFRRRKRQSYWRGPLLIVACSFCSAAFLGGTIQWQIARSAERECEARTLAGRKVTPQTYAEIAHQKDRSLIMFAVAGVAFVGTALMAGLGRHKKRVLR